MANYTKLIKSELKRITDNYQLKINTFQAIEEGSSNSNYFLSTDQGKYVLTIFEIAPSAAEKISRILCLLEEHNYPAPRLIQTTNGKNLFEYQNKKVMIKQYIPGRTLAKISTEQIQQIGVFLAKLHQIPPPNYLPREHAYLKDTYPMILEQNQDQKYKEWVKSQIDILTGSLALSLPTGFIHGDLFTDNVLIEDGKFKAVIDFEDAGNNLLIFDIGMAVVGLCREDSRIRLEKVRALVSGYQNTRILDKNEKQSLFASIELAAVLTSAWRFWKYNLTESNPGRSDHYRQMVNIVDDLELIPKNFFFKNVFERSGTLSDQDMFR